LLFVLETFKPSPLDELIFGCTARFRLSAMDVPASLNGRHFQATPAVSPLLPSAYAADLLEEEESFDSDDDVPSIRQALACSKRVIEVIDLTRDDDSDKNEVS
jgi:hypothetical protein